MTSLTSQIRILSVRAITRNNTVNKIKEAKKGIKYLNKDSKRKMAIPNTEKWNTLLEQGYKEGY